MLKIKKVAALSLAALYTMSSLCVIALPRRASAETASDSTCRSASVSEPIQAITDATRDRLGLNGFPDIHMGVIKNSDGTYKFLGTSAFGGNNGVSQRPIMLEGSLDNPVQNGAHEVPSIKNIPTGYKWIGGGPVYTDTSGTTIQMMHLERDIVAGGSHKFYSELHIGRVDPRSGQTTYLGPIATPELTYNQANRADLPVSVEMAAPTFVARGGFLYIYFNDFAPANQGVFSVKNLSVARAPIAEVINSAQNGKASLWHKYHKGVWASKAIGGPSTDLMPNAIRPWSPSVTYNAESDILTMISPISTGQMVIQTAKSGLGDWSEPTLLFNDVDHFNAYVTVVGKGDDPYRTGNSFYIYYLQWDSLNQDWSNARVMRRTVTCQSSTIITPLASYFADSRIPVAATAQSVDGMKLLRQAGVTSLDSGAQGILQTREPDTQALYSCKNNQDYMLSTQSDCEGYQRLGIEGWIYTSQKEGTKPLIRCYNASLGRHLISRHDGDVNCNGMSGFAVSQEGTLGFVPQTNQKIIGSYNDGSDSQLTNSLGANGLRNNGVPVLEKQWIIGDVSQLKANNTKRTQQGTIPLYNCWYDVAAKTNYFASVRSDCEGANRAGLIGYLYDQAMPVQSVELYRCYDKVKYDHFVADSATCNGAANTVVEGRLGFALRR